MSSQPVIVGPVRTAIGKFGKTLKNLSVQTLGEIVISESIRRSGLKPNDIEEVIIGNVVSAGLGLNVARQIAIGGGLPTEIGSVTVNKVCGSGLKAIMLAAQAVRAGDVEIVLAGGAESLSNTPHLLRNIRWGKKSGNQELVDSMIYDGLWDPFNNFHMGETGEIIAKKYGITREAADKFALESHRKAATATSEGRFREEIIPIKIKGKNGFQEIFELDECVRKDTSLDKLSKLKPSFREDGILTAGNSSQLSDGAAAMIVMSEEKANEMNLTPMAKIIDYGTGGTKPELVMEAPTYTCKNLLKKNRLDIRDIDLVEHNEAYSSASIAVSEGLEIEMDRLNVNGGAVAMGHPLGCTGARVLVTLIHALRNRSLKRGLATLCLGGGNAVAMIIEKYQE